MITPLTVLPDVESALMFFLVPLYPNVRFVTRLPAGDPDKLTARIARASGSPGRRRIWLDASIVEIDLWGFRAKTMDASIAARQIQASLLGIAGLQVTNGVIQHVNTVSGPRELPEVNQLLCRYNASYEVRLHP